MDGTVSRLLGESHVPGSELFLASPSFDDPTPQLNAGKQPPDVMVLQLDAIIPSLDVIVSPPDMIPPLPDAMELRLGMVALQLYAAMSLSNMMMP